MTVLAFDTTSTTEFAQSLVRLPQRDMASKLTSAGPSNLVLQYRCLLQTLQGLRGEWPPQSCHNGCPMRRPSRSRGLVAGVRVTKSGYGTPKKWR